MSKDTDVVQEQLVACVTGAVSATVLTVTKRRNATLARTGAGVLTLTLDPNGEAPSLPAAEALYQVSGGLVNGVYSVVDTSDTVKTITCSLGSTGAATDPTSISVRVSRLLGA